jgi:hypothetical protein
MKKVGLFITGNSTFADFTLGGAASFTVTPSSRLTESFSVLPNYGFSTMQLGTVLASELDESLKAFGSPKLHFVELKASGTEDVPFIGSNTGIVEVLRKHKTTLVVIGTESDFSKEQPAKLLLKYLLEACPEYVMVAPFVSSVTGLEFTEGKPLLAKAIKSQGRRAAVIYVSDVNTAIEIISLVDVAVIWNQIIAPEEFKTEFLLRLADLSREQSSKDDQYVALGKLPVCSGTHATDALIRGASVPQGHVFEVFETRLAGTQLFGKIKKTQERWVILKDGDTIKATKK